MGCSAFAEPAAHELRRPGQRGEVLFRRVEPMPPAQPRSAFTCLPVLGVAGTACDRVAPASRFLADDAVYTPSGKSATWLAMIDAGIVAGDEVIVPAYHCPTMIHPVLALGATPVMVPVQPDLSVTLANCRSVHTPRTRALLLPHFFAMVQPELDAIRAWCSSVGCVLIEDCAHAFYGLGGARAPGSVGDYAIASTRKFFVGSEGGALVKNSAAYGGRLRAATLAEEARGAFAILEEAVLYGLLGRRLAARAAGRDPSIGPLNADEARAEAVPAPAADDEIAAARFARRATRLTSTLVRHADHARIAGVRRHRYRRWAEVVEATRGMLAFHPPLSDELVPYVYPVRLTRPSEQFAALRYAGVAVWRWDKLAQSDCKISEQLALELIQLPCQHTLGDDAFEAQVRAFRSAVESAA